MGLRPQRERGNIADFGPKEAREAVKASKDYLDGKQQINSPVSSRNTAKGRPSAVLQYNVELNKRQENLLSQLSEYDSRATVRKADVSLTDLSTLTAKTGVEYAMFTKGGERLIIRGSSTKVNIDVAKAKELAYNGYRWSGHTHPGLDENTLIASSGDYEVLKAFGQKTSVIYNSLGRYMCFSAE